MVLNLGGMMGKINGFSKEGKKIAVSFSYCH